MKVKLRLDEDKAVQLADIFRMLSDPNRLRIAVICLGGPMCVGDIAAQAALSPTLASHHLRLLKAARFVKAKRDGKQVFYCVVDDRIRCVINDMVDHVAQPEETGIKGEGLWPQTPACKRGAVEVPKGTRGARGPRRRRAPDRDTLESV